MYEPWTDAYVRLILAAENSGLHETAYRNFIQASDDLNRLSHAGKVQVTADPPEVTGTRWTDAFAALIEYHLTNAGLPVPAWVNNSQGDVAHPWEPQRYAEPLPWPTDEASVAEPFARRGILIEENELWSV